jgi:hypothetical protein
MSRYAIQRGSIKEFFGTSSLMGCWNFNGNALDTSGNNIHGTVSGAAVCDGIIGGSAYRFNSATNDRIVFGNNFSFERTDKFSAIVWVQRQSDINTAIFAKTTAATTYRGWGFYINIAGGPRLQLTNSIAGNNYIDVTGVRVPQSAPICIGFSYDGSSLASGIKLFVNGAVWDFVIQKDALTSTITNSNNIYSGIRNPGDGGVYDSQFTGRQDEAGIFGVDLSPLQHFDYYAWSTDIPARRAWYVSSGVPSRRVTRASINRGIYSGA